MNGEQMKWIKIVKCSSKNYWYGDSIGKVFLVLGEGELGYCTAHGRVIDSYVDFQDAEVVENNQ